MFNLLNLTSKALVLFVGMFVMIFAAGKIIPFYNLGVLTG